MYYSLSLCDVRGVPDIVSLLCYLYDRQAMCVRWGNSLLDPFRVRILME